MNELIYVSPSCVGEHLVHLTSVLTGGSSSREEQPRKQNFANLIGWENDITVISIFISLIYSVVGHFLMC